MGFTKMILNNYMGSMMNPCIVFLFFLFTLSEEGKGCYRLY